MENPNMMKHTISLYVSNKPGVLIRIALVFARRGFNIDSIVASPSADPSFTTINIVATGDATALNQILMQLNKLVDVIHARDRTGEDIIERELGLFKVRCEPEKRSDILQVARAFDGEIVDLAEHNLTVQVSGRTEKLDAVNRIFEPYGLMEVNRTGKVLMARGEEFTP
jgi:acetolactate synthase I/III small subunit